MCSYVWHINWLSFKLLSTFIGNRVFNPLTNGTTLHYWTSPSISSEGLRSLPDIKPEPWPIYLYKWIHLATLQVTTILLYVKRLVYIKLFLNCLPSPLPFYSFSTLSPPPSSPTLLHYDILRFRFIRSWWHKRNQEWRQMEKEMMVRQKSVKSYKRYINGYFG